jgi:hypothetical protein
MSSLFQRFKHREESPINKENHTLQIFVSDSKDVPDKIGNTTESSAVKDVMEAEANQKLTAFEKAHRWDPNIGNDTLEEIDDAVNARDPNVERKLYDEVFENSPYPEVNTPVRTFKLI